MHYLEKGFISSIFFLTSGIKTASGLMGSSMSSAYRIKEIFIIALKRKEKQKKILVKFS